MKQISELISKTTIGSVLAIGCLLACFIILALTLLGKAKCSVETQTQIVSICSMVITSILAFYFGASHKSKQDSLTLTKTENE